jgi:AmpD protein
MKALKTRLKIRSLGTEDIEDLFLGRLDCSKHPAYRDVEGKELSAHFLVNRRGQITQFVDTDRAAYHAGRSSWQGRGGCNDYSVGIELEGDERHIFTGRQYHNLERIVGHSDIAPGRKTDPGPQFDWKRFRKLLKSV